jgi:hypothetical protein
LAGTIGSDLVFGSATLEVADNSDMCSKAKRELFALWLNIVSQKIDYYQPITVDSTVFNTTATTVGDVVKQTETTILNANATSQELENVKDLCEMLNVD